MDQQVPSQREMSVCDHQPDPRDVAAATAAYLVNEAARELRGNAGLTANDVLAVLRRHAAEFAALPPTVDRTVGECTHCHRPVGKRVDGSLTHLRPDGNLSLKGCRAASWDWQSGADGSWDESLSKRAYANLPA